MINFIPHFSGFMIQTIIWTNADLLSIGLLLMNFGENWIKTQ